MTAKTKTKAKAGPIIIEQAPIAQLPAPVGHNNPPASVSTASEQIVALMRIALTSPKLDVRKMREINDMQMEAMRFQAEICYNHALADCQAEIPHVHVNCENKHTKSKYANLEAIDTIIRPIVTKKYGFSLSFTTDQVSERMIKVTCCVRHREGHKEYHTMTGELDDGGFKGTANKTGIQAAGSSTSYLQRYLIKLIFNVIIIGEDNDGNKNKGDKKPDAFHEAVQGDQEEKPWDGKHIMIQGKRRDITTTGAGDIPDALAFLKEKLQKAQKQATRIAVINENLAFIKALAAAGLEPDIQALHALADGGQV